MPTITRLHLAMTSDDDTADATEVFDITDHERACLDISTVIRVLDAAPSKMPPALLASLRAWLASGAAAAAKPSADVEVPALSMTLKNARSIASPGRLLQEGTATFTVGTRKLKTRTPVVRAQTRVGGLTLSMMALVRTLQMPRESPLSGSPLVSAMHFVGRGDAELLDLGDLGLGKRASKVITHGLHASHFLQRKEQRQAHASAMQNLGLRVTTTEQAHTNIIDAYVSKVQHKDVQLECISVFI